MLFLLFPIQLQIELQHIDSRLAQKAPLATIGVLRNQGVNTVHAQATQPRHPARLPLRGGGADVRIKPAGRNRDQINRHRRGLRRVCRLERGNARLHGILERRVERAVVAAA